MTSQESTRRPRKILPPEGTTIDVEVTLEESEYGYLAYLCKQKKRGSDQIFQELLKRYESVGCLGYEEWLAGEQSKAASSSEPVFAVVSLEQNPGSKQFHGQGNGTSGSTTTVVPVLASVPPEIAPEVVRSQPETPSNTKDLNSAPVTPSATKQASSPKASATAKSKTSSQKTTPKKAGAKTTTAVAPGQAKRRGRKPKAAVPPEATPTLDVTTNPPVEAAAARPSRNRAKPEGEAPE